MPLKNKWAHNRVWHQPCIFEHMASLVPDPTEPSINLPNKIRLCGVLRFVVFLCLLAALFVGTPARADEPNNYTVKPGDSLNKIAVETGSTVRAIMAANSLRTTVVFYGDSLLIPSVSGEIYSVRSGDTLAELAKRHLTSVGAIMRANLLSSTTIFAGQRLGLPSAAYPYPPAEELFRVRGEHTYVVRPGDFLLDIVAKHRASTLALLSLNNMRSALVFPGQELLLPPPCVSGEVFAVGENPSFAWPSDYSVAAGSVFSPWHQGVDIGAPSGSSVYASADGQVAYSGWTDWGYGLVVVLSHPRGWQTLYAHLSDALPSCGAQVRKGDLIGFSGNSGNSSGPHLHYEVLFREKHINPAHLFSYLAESRSSQE